MRVNLKCDECNMIISGSYGGMHVAYENILANLIIDDISVSVTLYLIDDALLLTDILIGQDTFVNNNIKIV